MSPTESGLRSVLFWASVGTYVGAIVELALVEHWHGWQQWLPFVMAGAGVAAAVAASRALTSRTVRALRAVSALVVVGSVAGMVLHVRGNAEFALEVRPDTTGLDLVLEAATGASPLLAPGMMAVAAVLGAAWSWRHPALEGASSRAR